MILTYLRRELRRRRRAQLVIAAGLALGIALVLIVNAASAGLRKAQDEVLQSLYGLGTDMTVGKSFQQPGASGEGEEGAEGGDARRPRFDFDAQEGEEQGSDMLMLDSFATLTGDEVATIAGLGDVAGAVGGLSLRDIGVNGSFDPGRIVQGEDGGQDQAEEGQDSGGAAPGGPGGSEGGESRIGGGGAQFDVNQFSVFGADVSRPELGPLAALEVTEGRAFATDETEAEAALVDADYAAENDLAVGGTLTMADTDFEVIGLTTPGTGESTADVVIPLATAQRLSGHEDEVTGVYVQATDSTRLDAVAEAIGARIEDAEVTTADDLADQVSGSLSTAADLADGVGRWLSSLVLAAAFLVAGLLAASSVSRRVREFGTLKALGWTRWRVTRQVLAESLVTGLFGGALGLAVGLGSAWTLTQIRPDLTAELGAGGLGGLGGPGGGGGGPRMGFGGQEAAQSAGRSLDIGLTAPVSADIVVLAVALAVVGGLIAGAFAAWRAARLRPADAFRRIA
ncbi:ABC transporter permease [Streptomyces hoynatensis]|uniref:ABC transporter permease n=1 Tax=Streptomyces hoynatensis TaxID=1141874 RepID=A0A3A9ZF06_9ACTN|nr:ABC transporter permease [Streptomyces hoynatensis]RKN46920.1 ABC transporter permease [Streptomyces hoynatensis]